MFNRICLYNSKVFVPLFDEHGAFLVSYEHSVDSKQNFREIFRSKIPLKSFSSPKDVLLDTADNYVFGMQCIVILVISYSGDLHVFLYCNTIGTNVFSVRCIKCSSTITNSNIFLTHGPTLVTFFNGVLDFYSLCYKTKSSLSLQDIFPARETKILQARCVGQILNEEPLNVILLIVCGEIGSIQDMCIFSVGVHFEKNNKTVTFEKLHVSIFFDQFLRSLTKAIEVCNLFILKQDVLNMKEINWEENCSIVCTQTKCSVYCKSGLKYVVSLLIHDIILIKTDLNYSSFEIESLIVFDENTVCFYKPKKDLKELEKRKVWLDIQSIHIGDIFLNGSNQMVLIKNCSFEKWRDDYILTDISSITPVDIQYQTAIPDDCLAATISGLHAKFQAGKLAVSTKELETEQKLKATLDALNMLNDSITDNDHAEQHLVSSFQESLVDIILHKDENHKMEMNKRKNTKIKLLNHWIKTIDNKWFVCWTFLNEGDSVICNPTVKMIVPDQDITSSQKSFLHQSSTFSLEDECLRQIKSQQKFSVISVIECPLFYAQSIEAKAILSWCSGSLDEFENELFLPLEEKCLVQNQLPLTFSFKTEDVFTKVFQDISIIEELFCMKVLQQRIVFAVSSIHSNLAGVESRLLSSELGGTQLIVFENTALRSLVFHNRVSPLFGIHFMFKYIDENMAEVQAFIKNDKELCLLLQFLQQCLMEDIVFVPCDKTSSERKEIKQKIVCSMKEETDLLVSALNAHNISAQIQDYGDVSLQPGMIVIPRNTFLRIRRALVKKEWITDSILKNIYCTHLSAGTF